MANHIKPGDMVEVVRPFGPVAIGSIFKVTHSDSEFIWIEVGSYSVSQGGWDYRRFIKSPGPPKPVTMQDIPVWSLDELEQANAIIKELT